MNEKDKTVLSLSIGFIGAATLITGSLHLAEYLSQDNAMKERSNKLLTEKFSEAQDQASSSLMMNLKEHKAYNGDVIDEVFTFKDISQKTKFFIEAWQIALDSNYKTEATRLTLTTDGKPGILEVNASRPAKETGKEADQLIDAATEKYNTLKANGLCGEGAAGVYEIKDGAVIFQAASQPDTVQIMSLPAQTAQKTATPPTPGGPG